MNTDKVRQAMKLLQEALDEAHIRVHKIGDAVMVKGSITLHPVSDMTDTMYNVKMVEFITFNDGASSGKYRLSAFNHVRTPSTDVFVYGVIIEIDGAMKNLNRVTVNISGEHIRVPIEDVHYQPIEDVHYQE